MTRILLLFCFAALSFNLVAQEFGYGFKAGLNFNNMNSPLEKDDAGNTVEEVAGNTGFHVGVSFAWKATELMGVRGEFLYSQKGAKRDYNGDSYYTFYDLNNEPIYTTGTRKQSLNLSHSYLELPFTGYIKPFSWLEFHAGASVGFLVGSTAFGSLTYSGVTATGSATQEITYELDHNYIGDEAGKATFANPPSTIKIKGDNIPYPQIAGAYYEYPEDRGNLYKVIDLGLVGGMSIYFSKGLYVSGRVNYGLTDVTKTKADVSLVKLDGTAPVSRNDKDTNLSIQASVGFSF